MCFLMKIRISYHQNVILNYFIQTLRNIIFPFSQNYHYFLAMIRCYKLYLLMFWGVTSTLEGPPYLTQGCSKTCSAERRFLGSFTRSFEMRSFASKEISLHSVSGKSKCPSWMEWKSSSWHALQGSPWFQPHWEPQLPL